MSTDHTNESSWEASKDSATPQSYAVPSFDQSGTVDVEQGADDDAAAGETDSDGTVLETADDLLGTQNSTNAESESAEDSADESRAAQGDALSEDAGPDQGKDQPATAIEFRVMRPGNPVRRLRLTGNRYTFGSAEGCSIRLTDHGLRPMHAVLIRDAARILVRAYSVPIQVNGTRTTEATLEIGDVLRLGAYQFELLDIVDESQRSQGDDAAPPPLRSIFDAQPRSAFRGAGSGEHLFSRSGRDSTPADDLIWKEQLRREIEQWRERQVECDHRENRCDEREATLRDRETELWSRAENLYRRESRLQSQEAAAFQLYDEFSRRQQELIEMREVANRRQEKFQQREAQFRNQELEYRQRIDDATRQLHQSQQQADSATQAVQRMREQFDSLNEQIERLSRQHGDVESREDQQREQHEKIRLELEKSRDRAVEGQAESDVRRHEAEQRLAQLESHLEALKEGQGSDLEAEQAKLAQAELVADDLRRQVEELEQNLAAASDESERLRADYEKSVAKVVELESLIEANSDRDDLDRESWEAEAEELRAAVDELSNELTEANRELTELRDVKDQLTTRLDDMQKQRDEAREDAESRPSADAFYSIQEDLSVANEQLTVTRSDLDETRERLDQSHHQHQTASDQSADKLASALGALEEAQQEIERIQNESVVDPGESEIVHEAESVNVSDDVVELVDELVIDPEYVQDQPPAPVDSSEELRVDSSEEVLVEETSGLQDHEEDASEWNLESPNLGQQSSDDQPIDVDDAEAFDPNNADVETAQSRESSQEDDGQSQDLVDGSLASMLIQDLQDEAIDDQEPVDSTGNGVEQAGTELQEEDPGHWSESDTGWDQERNEESYASEWSNDPSGYRIEEITEEPAYADDESESTSWEEPVEEPNLHSVDSDPHYVGDPNDVGFDDPNEAGHPFSEMDADAEELSSQDSEPEPPAPIAGDDDSIEAYMNRLLRRVHGQPLDEVTETTPTVDAEPEEPVIDESESPDLTEPPIDPEAPMIPRSMAPEKTTSLSAMRELANASARIAITRSVRVQSRDIQIKGMVSFGSAAGALLCGAACYMFIPGIMRYVAVAMTAVVAVIYTREGALLFRESSQLMKGAEKQPSQQKHAEQNATHDAAHSTEDAARSTADSANSIGDDPEPLSE